MTDRIRLYRGPAVLEMGVFLTVSDNPNRIHFTGEYEGRPVKIEIVMEGMRCLDRNQRKWLIDGSVVHCSHIDLYIPHDRVRVCWQTTDGGQGELRKLTRLGNAEFAEIMAEIRDEKDADNLPEDLLDITRILTGEIPWLIGRWINTNPEFARLWIANRKLSGQRGRR